METLQLNVVQNSNASANIVVPQLVLEYIKAKDARELTPEGKRFRVVIGGKNVDNRGHGMSYFHQLIIEKRDSADGPWENAYTGPMIQYRSGFANGHDDWGSCLSNPNILKEDKNSLTFGLSTGDGKIKLFTFSKGGLETIEVFNYRDYETAKEKESLSDSTTSDLESFLAFTRKGLSDGWHFPYKVTTDPSSWMLYNSVGEPFDWKAKEDELKADTEFAVILAPHFDRNFDALVNYYRVYFWVKGQGHAITDLLYTGLRHRGGRFYSYGARLADVEVKYGRKAISVKLKVVGTESRFENSHEFKVILKSPIRKKLKTEQPVAAISE